MHAPATPGTSDSGSAAGSDSEQGSGSNVGSEDTPSFEVSSVTLRLDSTEGPLTNGGNNTIHYLNRSENIGIELVGENLDQISTAVLLYSDGYKTTRLKLARKDGCTDTNAAFSTPDFPKDNIFYIDAVILNGVYVINKLQDPKKIYIGAYTNSGLMGWVSGGGLKDFGSEVTLVPNAASGYHFVRWEDGFTEVTRTIIADKPYEFRAIFERDPSVSDEDISDGY